MQLNKPYMLPTMLKLYIQGSHGNILQEDLSGIKSDYKRLSAYLPEMLQLCNRHSGVGLSANQVGLQENFFVVTAGARFPSKRGNPAPHLCVNPTWVAARNSIKTTGVEGCLSLPGREFNVEREAVIDAEWTNAVGHRQSKTLKGWAARVFQHESDHLRGVTLLDTGKELS